MASPWRAPCLAPRFLTPSFRGAVDALRLPRKFDVDTVVGLLADLVPDDEVSDFRETTCRS